MTISSGTSKKGKAKVRYNPSDYPHSVNDVVESAKACCDTHGGTFQNAWMDRSHIQLEFLFDARNTTVNGHAESAMAGLKGKTVFITLNHPEDKSQITRIHPQGAGAKDDPDLKPLRHSLETLDATVRNLTPSDTKQTEYMNRDQVQWLLKGAGATDVQFVSIEHDIGYGVKVQGKYNGVFFCVLVYHQSSGLLNPNPKIRSAVWETPRENDDRISGLRKTLDMGIQSNMALQQSAVMTNGRVDLRAEKLTAKIGQMTLKT